MKKTIILVFAIVFSCVSMHAQEKGYVSASLESTNHFYVNDEANDFNIEYNLPQIKEDGFYASNNYLKVDYYNGRFSAGTQLEGYFPYLAGYPGNLNNMALSNLYVNWKDDSYSITAGTFYDQFGSGLLFRSWEDRPLGLNNAIIGARATYNFKEYVALKVLWGIPRMGTGNDGGEFFGFGLTDVNVAGADLSVSLADIFNMERIGLTIEGSVLNKHEKVDERYAGKDYKPNVLGWSGRVNFEYDGFFAKGEYVDAGKQCINIFAPAPRKGNAQLIELGYNGRGLGVTATGRRLLHMTQKIHSYETSSESNNLMSYIPALTTQYTYMLTTLHPYSSTLGESMTAPGEIGGQIDAFYNFRRGTKIGGKRGMRIHANFSTYYSLSENSKAKGGEFLFRDFSFDMEKQWTKKFKSTLLYSMQNYNKESKESGKLIGLSHIIVADLLYKFTPKFSTRMELQYLSSEGDRKDWMAGLLEVNLAPHWSVFASDMYNHGDSKVHYYNAGISFAMNHLRVAAGYGRYRAGFICSGGVCREIPAYTGANLTLTASF